ncbi:unnamed protein product [Rotaria socialis]|uniref:Uncharacterized protein n=1 Tax=Rotaria socialis TaxID=392032 RepID=A0A820VU61_9BILA|nr:unnamed protein product [Rotaria socialis]
MAKMNETMYYLDQTHGSERTRMKSLRSVRNWQTTPTNTRQSPSSPLLHHHLHPSDSSTIKRAYTMARITVQSTNTSRAKPYTIQGLVETLNEFVPMSTPGYDDPRKDRSGPAACQDM